MSADAQLSRQEKGRRVMVALREDLLRCPWDRSSEQGLCDRQFLPYEFTFQNENGTLTETDVADHICPKCMLRYVKHPCQIKQCEDAIADQAWIPND